MDPQAHNGLPTITAIALCYNHARFVMDCLESIKRQAYPNLQLLICDDASKDASPVLIREWSNRNPSLRPEFLHNSSNLGVCKTLNLALKCALGKYISIIATDDIWEAGKLLAQAARMEDLPETTGVLYSDAYRMDELGQPLPQMFIEYYRRFESMPQGNIHEVLWEGNFIPGMTTLIRRAVFEKVGFFDETLFYEDWDMWLRISEHYDFAFQSEPAARYRVVRTSMSKASVDRMDVSNELIYTKHLLANGVPGKVRGKAFNYAVRRVYRQRSADPGQAEALLNALVRRYRSPRLLYAWLLYSLGFEFRHYENGIRGLKQLVGPRVNTGAKL